LPNELDFEKLADCSLQDAQLSSRSSSDSPPPPPPPRRRFLLGQINQTFCDQSQYQAQLSSRSSSDSPPPPPPPRSQLIADQIEQKSGDQAEQNFQLLTQPNLKNDVIENYPSPFAQEVESTVNDLRKNCDDNFKEDEEEDNYLTQNPDHQLADDDKQSAVQDHQQIKQNCCQEIPAPCCFSFCCRRLTKFSRNNQQNPLNQGSMRLENQITADLFFAN